MHSKTFDLLNYFKVKKHKKKYKKNNQIQQTRFLACFV